MNLLACTAVVTEIAYHTKNTIDASISFLSEAEWRQELEVLLNDLVDENGEPKRSTDMRSDAGVAWSKVVNSVACGCRRSDVLLIGSRCLPYSHCGPTCWYDGRPNHCQRCP